MHFFMQNSLHLICQIKGSKELQKYITFLIKKKNKIKKKSSNNNCTIKTDTNILKYLMDC